MAQAPAGFVPDPPASTLPEGFVPDGAASSAPSMTFAIVNGQRVPVDAPGSGLGQMATAMKSVWDKANTPLLPQIADAAHAIADHLDAPKMDRSKTEAQIRGFFAGATQGAGDLASSFTSPIGLALTLAGVGEDTPIVRSIPALKRLVSLPAVRNLQAAVRGTTGAAMTAEGATNVITGDTAGEKLQGAMQAAGGLIGVGSVPAVREALGLDMTIPEWRRARQESITTKAQGQQVADLMKAIPPSARAAYDPGTIQRVRPYLEAEHANSPIASVADLRDAADSAITQIEEHVGQAIAAHPNDLIRTKPLAAAQRAVIGGARSSDLQTAMRELADFHLEQPKTVTEADAIRLRLNAENKAVLKRNNYDVATARQVDPAFAAREAAAGSLRDGIYGQLEARGVSGVADLRRDEGALIQVRNASQRQIFSGDKAVGGTGANGPMRRIAGRLVTMGTTAAGAMTGGPAGAVTGAVAGEEASRLITSPNLTRDQLVERAFSKSGNGRPVYPTIPADRPVAGLLNPPVVEGEIVRPDIVEWEGTRVPVAGLLRAPATPMGPTPDASFVRGVSAEPARRNVAGLLSKPAIPAGPGPDTSGGRAVPARGIVVRDPKTGRFRRVYTGEGVEP